MTNPRPKGFVGFLGELKRRHVYVTAVAYTGVSVVVIELTGAVSEALLFPDWTSRLVTFLLILGFPLALVLSWTFDLTGKGIVRTGEDEVLEGGSKGGAREGAREEGGTPGASSPVAAPSSGGSLRRSRPLGPRVALPPSRRRKTGAGTRTTARTDPPAGGGGPEAEEAPPPFPTPDPERVRRATLAHLRHELRTPVNGIIGYSEMLLEDVEDGDYPGDYGNDLRKIRAGGHQLLSLIDSVLGNGAVQDMDTDLEAYARRIRVDLRTPVTSVVGYAEMLLETAQEESHDDLVPDLEKVHAAAHRLLDLSGDIVGLATSGELAPGLDTYDASELTRSVLSKIQPRASRGEAEAEGRLLVVDDNAENRELLSRQLARQGYAVLTAPDGQEALEILASRSVDLILLDVIMPRMDGVETLTRIKADGRLQEIPVLMLSSLDEVDGALRCIEMGAEDYLSKPVKPAILEARINANLEFHRMRQRERVFQDRMAEDESFIRSLLRSSFPDVVAERALAGEEELADVVPEATVLVCKVRGLERPTSSGGLTHTLGAFREIFLNVESLAREHGVETCIWRADGFTAVAGAPTPMDDHLDRAADMARALRGRLGGMTAPDGSPLRLGLALHSGPVLGAALGGERLRYCVWGEGVDTAERVAETAPEGALLATPSVHGRLKERFSFKAQKVRQIGGVQMRTYLLD